MEEPMGVNTKVFMANDDGSITFPFEDEKPSEKRPASKKIVYRSRRKTMAELRQKVARLESRLREEKMRVKLISRIKQLYGKINEYQELG